MLVFRLARLKYSKELSGKGAAKYGNRWNSKGVEMVYTAESRALAMAEVAVHLSLINLPKDFVMLEIEIPEKVKTIALDLGNLGEEWNKHPPVSFSQKLGDQFIESEKHCILKVPSAVVPGDFNYLINAFHPDFKKIIIKKVSKFPFDNRIFQ